MIFNIYFMKKEIFLEKARKVHGYRYQYPTLLDNVMQMDLIDVSFEGRIYQQRVIKHFKGSRPENKTVNKTTEEFLISARKIWNDKYDYSLTEYKNARTKVKIIYEGIVYEQWPNGHLQGFPVEGFLDKKIFIEKSIRKWGKKYDYSLVDFKNAKSKVKIIFNGKIYEQTPNNHLNYSPEKANKKTTEEFILDGNLIHNSKFNYDKTIYMKTNIKLIITCPIHGDFEQTPNSHLNGKGCPSCKESSGEREVVKCLNKMDINFIRQKKFDDCKNIFPLPFDFYIASARTLIEFDGQQHFEPVEIFGGIEAYNKLKINDKIKNDYCEENYINLIRIRYDQIDAIPEILWESLKVFIK